MGIAGDSLIHADDTEVARNCKVLIDNQAVLSNLVAEMGTERYFLTISRFFLDTATGNESIEREAHSDNSPTLAQRFDQ